MLAIIVALSIINSEFPPFSKFKFHNFVQYYTTTLGECEKRHICHISAKVGDFSD